METTDAAARVAQAIAESIRETRIVTLDAARIGCARDALCDELAGECEDSADGAGASEYWGADDGGSDWRVHVAVVARASTRARTADRWWEWHDADYSRVSGGEDPHEATADAERRCTDWIAGDSDDGPEDEN